MKKTEILYNEYLDNLPEDALKCWAFCYIWKQLKIEELTDDQVEEIENIDYQGADRFDDIIEEINNILEIKGE